MKRCSTCNKTFTDEKLSYCVDDGTPLVEVTDDDDELTQVRTGTSWNAPAYQPPSYVPPPENKSGKRSTWPWLAAVIGLLVLALVGFTIAAVVYLPRLQQKAKQPAESTTNSNSGNTDANSADETRDEKNEAALNSPPPTDKDLVLGQLKDLEQEWTVANINADKKKLGRILADDYVGPTAQGRMQGKGEYISTIQRDTSIQKWEFSDLRLTLHGDRATLFGKIHFQLKDREVDYDFVDRFVWRDGRWQATGSEVTLSAGSSNSNL
jgi:hypothetical protein